jgi:hypothetical protein
MLALIHGRSGQLHPVETACTAGRKGTGPPVQRSTRSGTDGSALYVADSVVEHAFHAVSRLQRISHAPHTLDGTLAAGSSGPSV